MSRYDYRVRRKLFQRNSIEQHKDFGAFQRHYASRKRAQRVSRFVLILIALIILVGVAIFAANAQNTATDKSVVLDELMIKTPSGKL